MAAPSSGSRMIENQRRTALTLAGLLAWRLTPGRPFIAEVRSELALHKGFGSRDRRLYRELIFTWLRHRAWYDQALALDRERAADLLVALAPEAPEVLPLQTALGMPGGIANRPWPELRQRLAALVPGMDFELRALLPPWFERHCPELFQEQELIAQLRRPPFWLRAQRGSAGDLVHQLARSGIETTASPRVPGAVRVAGYVDLEEHPLVMTGRAEVQDIGSQALLAMAAPDPGGHWLDFCAGAGGKTLQLADLLGPGGRVTAHDIRREALVELKRRMMRSGLKNIVVEPVLPEPGRVQFDGVLVDAPCSASGTWRRHPFLRHQTTPAVIERYAAEQLKLLERAAPFVARGGRLVYATCSLSREENEEVVAAFLREEPDFMLERPPFLPGIEPAPLGWVTLLPSILDSDGYFLACLRQRERAA